MRPAGRSCSAYDTTPGDGKGAAEHAPCNLARRCSVSSGCRASVPPAHGPITSTLFVLDMSVTVYPTLLAAYSLCLQIFPRHVLEHIAMQNMAAAGKGGGGSGGGGRQRRKSQFDLLQGQDCSQLAHHHDQISVLFCDVKGFTVGR